MYLHVVLLDMGWTHDGCLGEEEGLITFTVMEGAIDIGFPKAILFPIFKLVHVVVETTYSGGFFPSHRIYRRTRNK